MLLGDENTVSQIVNVDASLYFEEPTGAECGKN